jgi:tryptophan synthase beta chain
MPLIEQEVSQERYIEIPEEVQDAYRRYRPGPMFRARALEKALGTQCEIYYKYEGQSMAGSHKPNTAIPQVYYNKQVGTKKLTTETGAGQWGSSLAYANSILNAGLEVDVYQVKVSYETKPYRRTFIETFGGKCYPSPSERTKVGREILAKDPNNPGSLGIAISEAVEACVTSSPDKPTKYTLGSVLNHVLMHQTVIGLEAIKQLEMVNVYPTVILGCTGGGSNFGGISFPFLGQRFRKEAKNEFRAVAVEPAACPSLTRGEYRYDFGDSAGMTPLMKTHTLGSHFMPPKLHSGGLRYHAMAPLVSHLLDCGEIEAIAVGQQECFEAGVKFARTEGILAAPEATNVIAGVFREVEKANKAGKKEIILFNLCGHGLIDLPAYENFLSGNMEPDVAMDESALQASLAQIPTVE